MRSLPHARGGVSCSHLYINGHDDVFPTPVGVFPAAFDIWCDTMYVFPTPVGVFPEIIIEMDEQASLPHGAGVSRKLPTLTEAETV